jgi:hypothetical protein
MTSFVFTLTCLILLLSLPGCTSAHPDAASQTTVETQSQTQPIDSIVTLRRDGPMCENPRLLVRPTLAIYERRGSSDPPTGRLRFALWADGTVVYSRKTADANEHQDRVLRLATISIDQVRSELDGALTEDVKSIAGVDQRVPDSSYISIREEYSNHSYRVIWTKLVDPAGSSEQSRLASIVAKIQHECAAMIPYNDQELGMCPSIVSRIGYWVTSGEWQL